MTPASLRSSVPGRVESASDCVIGTAGLRREERGVQGDALDVAAGEVQSPSQEQSKSRPAVGACGGKDFLPDCTCAPRPGNGKLTTKRILRRKAGPARRLHVRREDRQAAEASIRCNR